MNGLLEKIFQPSYLLLLIQLDLYGLQARCLVINIHINTTSASDC